MNYSRSQRISETIRREVSELLVKGLKDPRVGLVTIMDVKVTADLHYARIYISSVESAEQIEQSMQGLKSATGFIRRYISTRLNTRVTPEISFHYDDTPDKAVKMTKLINDVISRENEINPEETADLETEE